MPDSDQELVGNGHDGFVLVHAPSQALELAFPERMGVNCDPGGFDERPTDVTAAGLGNATGAMSLTADVDTGTQAAVADQLLGFLEAPDVTNGCQDRHGDDHPETGQLQQESDWLHPG